MTWLAPAESEDPMLNSVSRADILHLCAEVNSGVDCRVAEGLAWFLKNAICSTKGGVPASTVSGFVEKMVSYEAAAPLFSAAPFRYPKTPDLPEVGSFPTANHILASALANAQFMVKQFGLATFAASSNSDRKNRYVEWSAPLYEDYELRVRGGSGASTFSIDLGIGAVDRGKSMPKYKELWRTGIDTVHRGQTLGLRFIRTGSGVQPGDEYKKAVFENFRKTHGIMPQKLLGLLGLYFMRELDPDYAVTISTEGAQTISTLGRSRGICDYDGIFKRIGFIESEDPNWLVIRDFKEGFYEGLEHAGINRKEATTLDQSVNALNHMQANDESQKITAALFQLCTDTSKATIERELAVYMA